MKVDSFLFEVFEASVQAKDSTQNKKKIPVRSSCTATFSVVGLRDNKEQKNQK